MHILALDGAETYNCWGELNLLAQQCRPKNAFCLKHIHNCDRGFIQTSGLEFYFTLI